MLNIKISNCCVVQGKGERFHSNQSITRRYYGIIYNPELRSGSLQISESFTPRLHKKRSA